jgi:hypothetical protein
MDEVMRASTELDALVPELWSAAFYPTLLASLPFNSSVARSYEGEISALGDTVRITTFPQFDEASEMQEGEANPADSVTPTGQSLVINKQVAKDYIITKKAMKQSIDSQNALRDLALYAIMKKMQSIIIAEIVPSASAPDHAIAFTSGTTMALADILAGKELLDTADVEEPGRTMILGAAQWNDLFNITGFTSRDFLPDSAGSPLVSGQIATPILGFTPKMTTLAGNTAYLFQPIFLQMAVQQNPEVELVSLGSDGKRASRVNMDVLFGVKQCSNTRVVTVG